MSATDQPERRGVVHTSWALAAVTGLLGTWILLSNLRAALSPAAYAAIIALAHALAAFVVGALRPGRWYVAFAGAWGVVVWGLVVPGLLRVGSSELPGEPSPRWLDLAVAALALGLAAIAGRTIALRWRRAGETGRPRG